MRRSVRAAVAAMEMVGAAQDAGAAVMKATATWTSNPAYHYSIYDPDSGVQFPQVEILLAETVTTLEYTYQSENRIITPLGYSMQIGSLVDHGFYGPPDYDNFLRVTVERRLMDEFVEYEGWWYEMSKISANGTHHQADPNGDMIYSIFELYADDIQGG